MGQKPQSHIHMVGECVRAFMAFDFRHSVRACSCAIEPPRSVHRTQIHRKNIRTHAIDRVHTFSGTHKLNRIRFEMLTHSGGGFADACDLTHAHEQRDTRGKSAARRNAKNLYLEIYACTRTLLYTLLHNTDV